MDVVLKFFRALRAMYAHDQARPLPEMLSADGTSVDLTPEAWGEPVTHDGVVLRFPECAVYSGDRSWHQSVPVKFSAEGESVRVEIAFLDDPGEETVSVFLFTCTPSRIVDALPILRFTQGRRVEQKARTVTYVFEGVSVP
jgi:hypothetical protein